MPGPGITYIYFSRSMIIKEKKLIVAEIRMLRWLWGVIKLERIRSVRGESGINMHEIRGKKIKVVRTCHEKG